MNKLQLLIGILLFTLLPATALAAEFKTDPRRAVIPAGTTVRGDLYIASGDVDIAGTVDGDVFAAGGTVRVSGAITGDFNVIGGDIRISGQIGDDLRAAGGTVSLEGKVADDFFIAGGNVEIFKEARVGGGTWVGAGNFIINGVTKDISAAAGQLSVTDTARIEGDLKYISEREGLIEAGAQILGQTIRQAPRRTTLDRVIRFGGVFPLFTLFLALLFLYAVPNKAAKLALDWRQRFSSNLLWGFLFLVALPAAIFLFFFSIISFPIGIGLALVYPILLYIGHLVAVLGLGTWIKKLINKGKEPKPDWLTAVLGVAAVAVLGLIPIIGWLALFLAFLAGLGSLVRFDWDLVVKLRSAKTL